MRPHSIGIVILCLSAVSLLAACGGSSSSTPPPSPGESATLFAADGRAGYPGYLYAVNPLTGASTPIGKIGFALTGLAFSPSGTLYGTESTQGGEEFHSRLILVNKLTGAGTAIGDLQDTVDPMKFHDTIAGLTFVGTRLIGWSENGDDPVEINTTNGQVTVIGPGSSSAGSGIAANAMGTVFCGIQGISGTLDTVDALTGVVTVGPALSGGMYDEINSMTFLNGTLFATDARDTGYLLSPVNLATIDPLTGVITQVGPLPNGVDAIAGITP